jgi:hypothetical protein
MELGPWELGTCGNCGCSRVLVTYITLQGGVRYWTVTGIHWIPVLHYRVQNTLIHMLAFHLRETLNPVIYVCSRYQKFRHWPSASSKKWIIMFKIQVWPYPSFVLDRTSTKQALWNGVHIDHREAIALSNPGPDPSPCPIPCPNFKIILSTPNIVSAKGV